MKTIFSAVGLTLALGVFSLTGCRSANTCTPGYQNCACTAEGACNVGLVCDTNVSICVDPNDGSGGQNSGSGGGNGSGGGDGSGGEDSGTGSTTGTGGTIGGTGGTIGGTGGGSGTCTEGTSQGSCSTGNALDCYLGEWLESESCPACGVVYPSSACDRVTAFMLDYAYTPVTGGVASEIYSASGAQATFTPLYSDDIGYLQFKFPYAISPTNVGISVSATSGSVAVTLESGNNGESGCNYYISGGTLVWDELAGCWGAASPMGTGVSGSPVTVLNVRVSGTASPVTLTVSGISFSGI